MSTVRWTIFARESGSAWRIASAADAASRDTVAPVLIEPQADERAISAELGAALRSRGWRGEAVMLALPAPWCLAATIETAGPPQNGRRAMLYRLEEKLPLAAEDVVADFASALDGNSLGVATRLATVRPLVEALENAGVPVASISPAALLAAQDQVARSDGDASLVIREGDDRASIVTVRGGNPVSWSLVPASAADVAREAQIHQLTHGGATDVLVLGDLSEEVVAALGAGVRKADVAPDLAAAHMAAHVLAGRRRPWIELRRDALAPVDRLRAHRRPLHAVLAAAAILLLAIAAGLIVRGVKYDRAARASDAQLTADFQRAFPGWPVPVNVRAVVQSEHRKRIDSAGGGGSDTEAAMPAAGAATSAGESALRTLRDVLAALPADAHFSLQRMTFDDGGFELEGRTTYTDLSPLIAAARSAGFALSPPVARREADGAFGFTLHGTREKPPAVATGAR